MDLFFSSIWTYGGAFLLTITVIVFFHELGHFLTARFNGVKVEVFSIGFGPELFGWNDRQGTRWKIALLPLGGYVKMFGQSDTGPDGEGGEQWTEEEKAQAFPAKRVWQRFAIVAGGPIANFILAIVLFAAVFAIVGRSQSLPEITEVMAGSAAETAGLQAGDRVLSVDGANLDRFDELQYIVSTSAGQPLAFEVARGDEILALTVVPDTVMETDGNGNEHAMGRLGVRNDNVVFEPVPLPQALWGGVEETWAWSMRIFDFLGKIIGGTQSSSDLAGPLGIAQMSSNVAEHGLPSLITFMAILSVNLGLINLFPVPMLDGGHLMFYVIEAFRGRPLSVKAQEYGFFVGMGLVGALFLFFTFNDLSRFGLVDFLSGLVS
ncbi:MAG: RIP metalloprotease RseP [Proteobacteria bacterium]|nr:RIP metalloprotease RseP [Pseudomonadota bacterium]